MLTLKLILKVACRSIYPMNGIYNKYNNQNTFRFNIYKRLMIKSDNLTIKKDIYLSGVKNSFNIFLKYINDDDIPTIIHYQRLDEALWTASGDMNNPSYLIKKIFNVFDIPDSGLDVEEDLKKLSCIFYKLFMGAVKIIIIDMKDEKNFIRGIRNALCHENYFSFSKRDTFNLSSYEKIKEKLPLHSQQELNRLEADDWRLWNINPKNGNINFFYVIKEEDLFKVIREYKCLCVKIIEKSRKKHLRNIKAICINDTYAIQFIQYLHLVDKLTTDTS